jgi:hypothetical protein
MTMTSLAAKQALLLLFAATVLLPAPSDAAPAPAPTFESVAGKVTSIPKESAVTVLRMMRPEGFKAGEEVKSFEVQPWDAAANTWLALLAVDGCEPLVKRTGVESVDVPWLWLALVHLPPPPARPALLARPVGGFMLARESTVHRYNLGQGPIRIGPGKQAFVVKHGFNIPFGGGGADVLVDHLFWVDHGSMALVFSAVSKYDAMYGGDWHEDGTRDHPEENVSLDWEVTKKMTDGFFNLRMHETDAGPKARKAVYAWQGTSYATSAKEFFGNEGMCLEDGALTSPSTEWQKQWLGSELKRLLASGDVDGVMGLDLGFQDQVRQGDGLLDKTVRAQLLTLAHKEALARYKTDPTGALRLLAYGICQSTEPQGLEAGALDAAPPAFETLLQVADGTTVAALNDYAFILSKNKRHVAKAAALLRAVLALDPKRKVAYLNLADVLWSQGKKDEARERYRRYLELAGDGAPDVPPRARERGAASLQAPH